MDCKIVSLTLKYFNNGNTTTNLFFKGVYKGIPYFLSGNKKIAVGFWNDEVIINETGDLNELFSDIDSKFSAVNL